MNHLAATTGPPTTGGTTPEDHRVAVLHGYRVLDTPSDPELDAVAICDRIDAYSAHGYYEPHEQEHLKAAAREAMVTEPVRLLARFVELYART